MPVMPDANTLPTGPVTDSIKTLVDLFRHATAKEKKALLNVKRDGRWRPMSSVELLEKVRLAAMGLYALGVRPGNHIGLLSENRVEWTIADLAVINCGATAVPIYSTQSPKQVAYILNDAGV